MIKTFIFLVSIFAISSNATGQIKAIEIKTEALSYTKMVNGGTKETIEINKYIPALNKIAKSFGYNGATDQFTYKQVGKELNNASTAELSIVFLAVANRCYKENGKIPFFLRFDPLSPKRPTVNIYYSCGGPNKKDLDALTVKAKKIKPKKEKGRFPASILKEYFKKHKPLLKK